MRRFDQNRPEFQDWLLGFVWVLAGALVIVVVHYFAGTIQHHYWFTPKTALEICFALASAIFVEYLIFIRALKNGFAHLFTTASFCVNTFCYIAHDVNEKAVVGFLGSTKIMAMIVLTCFAAMITKANLLSLHRG